MEDEEALEVLPESHALHDTFSSAPVESFKYLPAAQAVQDAAADADHIPVAQFLHPKSVGNTKYLPAAQGVQDPEKPDNEVAIY